MCGSLFARNTQLQRCRIAGEAVAVTAKNTDQEASAAKKAATDSKIGHGDVEHEFSEEDLCNAKQIAVFRKLGRLSVSPWPESEAKTEPNKLNQKEIFFLSEFIKNII